MTRVCSGTIFVRKFYGMINGKVHKISGGRTGKSCLRRKTNLQLLPGTGVGAYHRRPGRWKQSDPDPVRGGWMPIAKDVKKFNISARKFWEDPPTSSAASYNQTETKKVKSFTMFRLIYPLLLYSSEAFLTKHFVGTPIPKIKPSSVCCAISTSNDTTVSESSDCPYTAVTTGINNILPSTTPDRKEEPEGPSFLAALFGIAVNGSPWEYMLSLRADGFDGLVPVDLGPVGKYNFLLSPEAVRSVTVEKAPLLPRRFSVPLFETLELDRGIVYEQGDRHKRNKRLCIPSFEQTQSMESFVAASRDELDDLSERFRRKIGSTASADVDLYVELKRAALDVVLAVTFGLGSGKAGASTFDRADELNQIIGDYLENIVALANEIPPLWQISPRLSPTYVEVTDRLLPGLRELVAEVIAARRLDEEVSYSSVEEQARKQREGGKESPQVAKTTPRKSNKADLLSILVEEPDLDDNDIRSILFDIVIAGSDTTAVTMTAALYVLHEPQNAYWLQRAREEAVATDAGNGVALRDLQKKLPVSTAITREILRLYPPVPFVGRSATGEGTLCDGQYQINKGETYCFSGWFLGRDPKAWGDDSTRSRNNPSSPADGWRTLFSDGDSSSSRKQKRAKRALEFDPQRWLDDPVSGGAPSTFCWFPFGAGPRGCLGTRLGLTEVVLGISRLLKDFEFRFEKSGPLPVRYDLTLNLDGDAVCEITNRNQ